MLEFEWNPAKAESNLRKHGISFDEAASAFGDLRSLTIPDPDHSIQEQRYLLLGYTVARRLVVVSHMERGIRIRIISARLATPLQRRIYEKSI